MSKEVDRESLYLRNFFKQSGFKAGLLKDIDERLYVKLIRIMLTIRGVKGQNNAKWVKTLLYIINSSLVASSDIPKPVKSAIGEMARAGLYVDHLHHPFAEWYRDVASANDIETEEETQEVRSNRLPTKREKEDHVTIKITKGFITMLSAGGAEVAMPHKGKVTIDYTI